MTPVNFFDRSLISYALGKRQSRTCGMSISLALRNGRKPTVFLSIIEQIAAAQTSIEAKVRRLNEPD